MNGAVLTIGAVAALAAASLRKRSTGGRNQSFNIGALVDLSLDLIETVSDARDSFDVDDDFDQIESVIHSFFWNSDYKVLGVGGSRVVIGLPDGFAAKIAFGDEGIAQNRKEHDTWVAADGRLRALLSPVVEIDADGMVVITREAQPFSSWTDEVDAAATRLSDLTHINDASYAANWGRQDGQVKLIDYGF